MSEKTSEQIENDNRELSRHLLAAIGLLRKFYTNEAMAKGMDRTQCSEYVDEKLKQHIDALKEHGYSYLDNVSLGKENFLC